MEQLNAEPLPIALEHEALAEGEPFYLNSADYLLIMHQALYAANSIPVIPYLVRLLAERRSDAFEGLVDAMARRATSFNFAAYYTVECFERSPFNDLEVFLADDGTLRSPLVDLVVRPAKKSDGPVDGIRVTFRGQEIVGKRAGQ